MKTENNIDIKIDPIEVAFSIVFILVAVKILFF